MTLTVAGTVADSCHFVTWSQNFKKTVVLSQIATQATISHQFLPVNYILVRQMRPNPSDFSNAFFSYRIKTKTNAHKAFWLKESLSKRHYMNDCVNTNKWGCSSLANKWNSSWLLRYTFRKHDNFLFSIYYFTLMAFASHDSWLC